MKKLVAMLAFVGQGAWAQAVKPADVEKNIVNYENLGRSNLTIATDPSDNGPNSSYRKCISTLTQLRLTYTGHQLRTPKGTEMLALYSYQPTSGLYIYHGDRVFRLDMNAETQKFKRCSIDKIGYAFDLDFGGGEVVHMEGNSFDFKQVANPPSKKLVPYPCTARMQELTNSEDSKDRLNAFVLSSIQQASQNFKRYTSEFAEAKQAYREAAPKPNPFGNKIDKDWMDYRYGQPIAQAARWSMPSMFKASLDYCAAIPSPVVKKQVDAILADLKLDRPSTVTGSAATSTR